MRAARFRSKIKVSASVGRSVCAPVLLSSIRSVATDQAAKCSPDMNPNSESHRSALDFDALVAAEALSRRPFRAPDLAGESSALVDLARSLAEAPEQILQKLSDTILTLCRAQASGVSLPTR